MHTLASTPSLAALAGMSGSQLALIAIILVAIAMMVITNRRRFRETGPSPRAYAREQMARLKDEKVVHNELADVMTQLQQVAREINAQLDAKFVRLEKSIRDADDRLERLDRLMQRSDRRTTLDVTVDDALSNAASDPEDRRPRIYALADEGKKPQEIARAIGIAVGEVDLVLAVRARGDGAPLSVTA